jgi:hypothetical protein
MIAMGVLVLLKIFTASPQLLVWRALSLIGEFFVNSLTVLITMPCGPFRLAVVNISIFFANTEVVKNIDNIVAIIFFIVFLL